jgi:hypothetical protein
VGATAPRNPRLGRRRGVHLRSGGLGLTWGAGGGVQTERNAGATAWWLPKQWEWQDFKTTGKTKGRRFLLGVVLSYSTCYGWSWTTKGWGG